MRLNDYNASIRAVIGFFEETGLWKSTVHQSELPRSEDFNKTSLTSQDYNAIYEKGLALSHYNFLLQDLAYFQFSHDAEAEYAMAFYPNPRLSGSPAAMEDYLKYEKQLETGEITDEDFADIVECMPPQHFIPRIRFEYSERQYQPVKHAAAHFHIGMAGEDRWPSGRRLSPKSFGMLIAKLYYPEVWWNKSRFSLPASEHDKPDNKTNCLDERLLSSMRTDGTSHHFGANEKLHLHFAAFLT